MKKTNKLLSVLLTLALFASLLPFAALPARADSDNACGDGLTWTLDGTTLTITGTGAMWDYDLLYVPAPWDTDDVASVVIGSGVTSIGNYAFYDCTSLTSVVIPDTVTSIGNHAFYGCTSLASVVIGSGVTTIGDNAFYNCTALASVVIPDSVTTICGDAFNSCESLTSVVIPGSVTSIGSGAFQSCENLTSVVIPGSVTTIGTYAFQGCTSLASVVIPDSVETISINAFQNCTNLASVVIPNSVKTISGCAFEGCTNLASVVIPDSVTKIDSYAFQGCTSLKYVFFPGSTEVTIGADAFKNCDRLALFRDNDSKKLTGAGVGDRKFTSPTPVDNTWSALYDALPAENTAAYIKLTGDVTFDSDVGALTVLEGSSVLLDLAGHTINGAYSTTDAQSCDYVLTVNGALTLIDSGSGSVLTVSGALTLADCDRSFSSSGDKATGKIAGGSAINGGGVYVGADATFTLSGGTIGGTGENDKNTASSYGGGVYVGSSGTFTMTGGAVSNNETGEGGSGGGVYVGRSATFTMLGGTVSDNKAHANETYEGDGGGVYVDINGTFTMSGSATVSRNEATSAGYDSADGGGVYVDINGTFTMSGSATVSDNKAENGGGVCVGGSGSTFTMSGSATVSDNKAENGGGVFVTNGGAFAMSGGAVSGNETGETGNGGGVYVSINGTFTMTGGTVSDNKAGFGGGGVYVGGGRFIMAGGTVSGNTATYGGVFVIRDDSTFRVSGAPVVRNNNGNNVKLNGPRITVAAPLTDGAELWIYAVEDAVVAQADDGHTLTDTDAEKFRSDDGFCVGKLVQENDKNVVQMVLRPALSNVSVSGGKLTVTVAAPANSTLIAASYDENDRLTGVATTTFSERKTGTVEVSALPKNAARYRVFLVDGKTCAPLCPAAAFKPGT